MAFAWCCASSCKDGTTPVAITNLVPPDEPDLIDMSLTIGGATVMVTKQGVVSGQIVLRPGANAMRATFLRFGDVPDTHVTADAFRLEVSLNGYADSVFVASPGDPFSGTLTIANPGNYTIRVVLDHVTRGHDDWNTDVTKVYVRT